MTMLLHSLSLCIVKLYIPNLVKNLISRPEGDSVTDGQTEGRRTEAIAISLSVFLFKKCGDSERYR